MIGSGNAGLIEYDARINTSHLKADAKQADSIAKQTGENIGKNVEKGENRASAALMKFGKRTALAFGVASAATFAFGVKSAASFEQTRVGMENMLGSADKARVLLGKISKFAAETPFEFPELAQATRQLLAFGFNAKDAFDTMTQLGDVSAAVGAPIGDLAYLMGTLKTQGRAMMIDIRQFAQRGIPIYEYLAKVLGKNTKQIAEMISAGEIGFPEVQKAFKAMTAEGGKFHGTMAKQSKTLSGLMSTLKDNLGFVLRNLIGITNEGDIVAGSIFDRLRQGAAGFIGFVDRNMPNIIRISRQVFDALSGVATAAVGIAKSIATYLAPKLKTLFDSFGGILPTLATFLNTYLKPIAAVLGKALVIGVGLAIDALNLLITILQPTFDWLNKHKGVVWAVVGALGAYYGALKLIALYTKFMAFLDAASNAMVLFKAKVLVANTQMGIFSRIMGSPFALTVTVAAALIAIGLVIKAAQEAKRTIQAMNNTQDAITGAQNSNEAVQARLRKLYKSGTPAQKKRALVALRGLSASGYASGTNYAQGGMSWVGERGPELIDLPRGSKVIPNNKVDEYAKGNNVTVQLNMSGIMARSRTDLRSIAKDMIESVNEQLRAKGVAEIGGGAL